jgi:triosephosphate isomerase
MLTIIGNWKMNKTVREAADYIETLAPLVQSEPANVFLAVPFTAIHSVVQYAKNTTLVVGAQNMHEARDGAFTGEVSAVMLKDAGASFVILGHSERRHVFGETDAQIQLKVHRALADDLQPVLCVGETWEQRDEAEKILRRQITAALKDLPKEAAKKLILAYEPVWAIGTGKTATPELIAEAHGFCYAILEEILGDKIADRIPILYGGSVNADNAGPIIQQPHVNGVLVGGASLNPKTFAEIVHNTVKWNLKK